MDTPPTTRARQRARLYWIAGLLMLCWLAAQLALQLVAADAGQAAFVTRTIANIVQSAVVITLLAWLLVSNTNRPRAIHPDDVMPTKPITQPPPEPFASATPAQKERLASQEEEPVLEINGTPIYGRRKTDNREAIRMAIQRLEDPDSPLPDNAPAWVKALAVRDIATNMLTFADLDPGTGTDYADGARTV